MQIVIDIDERRFKDILRISTVQLRGRTPTLEQVIAKGIPLPEHHGRLGDLDKLYTEMNNGIKAGNYEDGYESYGHINGMDDCLECAKYADTIIEADRNPDGTQDHEDKEEKVNAGRTAEGQRLHHRYTSHTWKAR